MSLTVKELLESEEFREYKLAAGKLGENRKILAVSVMDAPDIYQWLRGGEILITTGYLFKENIEFLSFLVRKIYEANAAALFIKIGRFIDEIPQDVIELANQLHFPIVIMPLPCAFIDVINPVLSKIIWEQAATIEYSNRIHKRFIDLTIQGKGIGEVVVILEELLQKKAVYYDMLSHTLFTSSGVCEKPVSYEEISEQYTSFPLKYEDKIYGYIGIKGEDILVNDYEEIIIEHASTVLKLNIQKQISNRQIEKRYRDSFVRDIIYHNINNRDEILRRGKNFGWNLEGAYRVILIGVKENEYGNKNEDYERRTAAVLEGAVAFLKQWIPDTVYTGLSDQIVLIVKENDISREDYIRISQKVINKVREQFEKSILISFGMKKEDIYEADESFEEAKYTQNLAFVFGEEKKISFYDELGLYTLLDKLKGDKNMGSFTEECLKPLLIYDREHTSEYMETLKEIVENNWNLKTVSERTFMHYNTIKKRYHKIEEILGMDFESAMDRTSVELAIRFRKVLKGHKK